MSLLPHLQCRPDQIAERVVLCGDPAGLTVRRPARRV